VSADLSALVVLRPAGGRPLAGDEAITAETVAEFLPDPASAERVRTYFRDRGFDVGPLVAASFSISGPRSRFEETFGVGPALAQAERVALGQGGGDATELALESLPPEVAGAVEAVTFTRPPDFGPTSP
jgi:hypothetical protein